MPEPTDIAAADEATHKVAPPLPRDEVGPACPNCGENFRSCFCPNCGERRVESEDYSLRRFLGEAFNILTSFESNLFRSFATLIKRPGLLTTEYFKGRRKSYLKPLQLFIFCNLIFFFVQSFAAFNSLTTPLYVHLNMLPYSQQARSLVERELQERKITYDEYRPRFDAAIEGQAKTLVIVMVPLYALLMQVLYWRTRRRYYVEHLVFSTHFFAFFLLFLPALHLTLLTLARGSSAVGLHVPALLRNDTFLTLLMLFLCGIYLWFALRRVYVQGKIMTTIKCVALVGCIMAVIQLYRLILFFTTFYTI